MAAKTMPVNGNFISPTRPIDVGVLALEVYFPRNFVDQGTLEDYDNVSKGKVTVGLGQKEMGFCDDNEDINSLCLTVVARLMEKMKKYDIGYKDIGRLEVGTETIIDKSKSVKTVLMKLFEDSGNFDVEGIDTKNACYGGTSALFNSLAWMESSFWDGRYALVVCGDIAVYSSGNARCTGGAGSIAMLIGPHAPLVIEPGLRGSFMQHSYDFYKPDLTSEYPVVDGKLSVQCYMTALDSCYHTVCAKAKSMYHLESFSLENFDFMLFHSPFCKLVQKSLARLTLNDYIFDHTRHYSKKYRNDFQNLNGLKSMSLPDTINNKEVEKLLMSCSQKMFDAKTLPSLMLPKRVGNMYTPSLYSSLVSLLINVPVKDLVGKRIGMFSYGSGLASSMFSILVRDGDTMSESDTTMQKFTLKTLIAELNDVLPRLDNRLCVHPREFTAVLKKCEETHKRCSYKPTASSEVLFPGTFYLACVDDKFRRHYLRKSFSTSC